MIVILGWPDSGKSAYAEELAEKVTGGAKMAYIATMIPFDDQAVDRIKRHRKLRENKNFETFEEAYSVFNVVESLKREGIETVLLECLSNLTGNVMHMDENKDKSDEKIIEEILNDILSLSYNVKNLIVVANRFDIKEEYDADTVRYISINEQVNKRLMKEADSYALVENGEWIIYDNN